MADGVCALATGLKSSSEFQEVFCFNMGMASLRPS